MVVVLARVTGRRVDELIRACMCEGVEDLVPLTQCLHSVSGQQPGRLGDGSQH